MNGKLVGGFLVLASLSAGAGVYYTQMHGYYTTLDEVPLVLATRGGEAVPVPVNALRAIDAQSSPLRFRACLRTQPPADLPADLPADAAQTAPVPYEGATPLTAPNWFDCFDARVLSDDLGAGRARAYLSEHDIHPGVDRVMAIYPDGRAYVWQQLNDEAGK